jgi:hypothetical protein
VAEGGMGRVLQQEEEKGKVHEKTTGKSPWCGAHRRGGGGGGISGAPAPGTVTPCADKQRGEVAHQEVEPEGKEKQRKAGLPASLSMGKNRGGGKKWSRWEGGALSPYKNRGGRGSRRGNIPLARVMMGHACGAEQGRAGADRWARLLLQCRF